MGQELAVGAEAAQVETPRRAGRRPKEDSRADELRERLLKWSYFPREARPSLRRLAEALNTSHQLLSHLVVGLEEWERKQDLTRVRVLTKRAGAVWTEAQQTQTQLKFPKWRREHVQKWVKVRPGGEARRKAFTAMVLRKFGPAVCDRLGLLKPEDPMAMWATPPGEMEIWRMLWPE
jgi:hypothetical protein